MTASGNEKLPAPEPDGHSSEVAPHHPDEHERPEDWGWHMQMGGVARGAGWVVVVMLLVLNIGNQTRHTEDIWLTALALLLAVILLADRRRRKNSWRS